MLYSDLLKQSHLTESQQLDEISLDQIGRGIGGVLGGIGKTAGAIGGIPQGLGRAMKKGYRGSVKGIGGEDDAASTVPGAAAGEKQPAAVDSAAAPAGKAEMPIGSGTINPKTGRPYVPSDFAGSPAQQPDEPQGNVAAAPKAPTAPTGGRTAAQIQSDLRRLDAAYKMQRNALNQELAALDADSDGAAGGTGTTPPAAGGLQAAISGSPAAAPSPAPAAPTAPEPMSIGGQKIAPTDPLYAKIAAQSGIMQNQALVKSIQALDKQKLETVKRILQQKASGNLEEAALGSVIKTAGKGLAAAGRGAANLAKGVKLGVTNPQAAANLSKNPNTGMATKIGRGLGRGLAATGRGIKATPGALAKGAGAAAGVYGGMKQAYAKGKEASTKFIGQGDLSWDQLQVELAQLSADDAKTLLNFVNQMQVTAPAAKAKSAAKPAAKAKSGAGGKMPGYTGRAKPTTVPASATVHESLTWSKNFDPSRHLITQLKRT